MRACCDSILLAWSFANERSWIGSATCLGTLTSLEYPSDGALLVCSNTVLYGMFVSSLASTVSTADERPLLSNAVQPPAEERASFLTTTTYNNFPHPRVVTQTERLGGYGLAGRSALELSLAASGVLGAF